MHFQQLFGDPSGQCHMERWAHRQWCPWAGSSAFNLFQYCFDPFLFKHIFIWGSNITVKYFFSFFFRDSFHTGKATDQIPFPSYQNCLKDIFMWYANINHEIRNNLQDLTPLYKLARLNYNPSEETWKETARFCFIKKIRTLFLYP